MADVDNYLNLITEEHSDKPKFVAMVAALTQGSVDIQNLETSLPGAFDLDAAVGVQLDQIGAWIGISRYLNAPLVGVYFEFDGAAGVGWESGSWIGPYDSPTGIIVLPDDTYRSLLKAKAIANSWDGTLVGATEAWNSFFGEGQFIIIQDNQDMSIVIGFSGATMTAIQQALLLGGYIPLKPAGVRVAYYAIPVDDGPLFAWDIDNSAMSGWETGSWAQLL